MPINKNIHRIDRFVIIGGIHGNELTGAYIVKLFEQCPHLIQRQGFETLTVLGNPQAFAEGRRYIDKDLNRCFVDEHIHNPRFLSYEDNQAREIHKNLKLIDKSQTSIFVDLHSTTANMGLTLILLELNPFLLQLAAHLCSISREVKILYMPNHVENGFLIAQSELGFAIEVGAVPQGILNADLFQKTREIVFATLDYVEAFNRGSISSKSNTLTLYEYIDTIDYPRNKDGEIQAMIHPQLQYRDYEPLKEGDPIFLTFDGTTIPYEGESAFYPVFINEAAYYEKGIAMCLSKKQQIAITKNCWRNNSNGEVKP